MPPVAPVAAEVLIRAFEDGHFCGAKDGRGGADFSLCLKTARNFAATQGACLAFAAGWMDGYRGGRPAGDARRLFGDGAGTGDQRPLVEGPAIGPPQLMVAYRDGHRKGAGARGDFRACLKPGTYNTLQEAMAYAAGWIDGRHGRPLSEAGFAVFGGAPVPSSLLRS